MPQGPPKRLTMSTFQIRMRSWHLTAKTPSVSLGLGPWVGTARSERHKQRICNPQPSHHLLSRQRVCAPLPAFGGPGLPLAALPDTDGILAPHRRLRRAARESSTAATAAPAAAR